MRIIKKEQDENEMSKKMGMKKNLKKYDENEISKKWEWE